MAEDESPPTGTFRVPRAQARALLGYLSCEYTECTVSRSRRRRRTVQLRYFHTFFHASHSPVLGYNWLRSDKSFIYSILSTHARVAKLADARDLKSRVPKGTYRFDSGPGHHNRRIHSRTAQLLIAGSALS